MYGQIQTLSSGKSHNDHVLLLLLVVVVVVYTPLSVTFDCYGDVLLGRWFVVGFLMP